MSSEIDKTLPTDEDENIEPSSSEKLFRIWRYLLILVTFQWTVCIIVLAIRIYSVTTKNEQNDISSETQSLITIFALTFYYTCGLLFIYRYHRIGILIFASIGMFLFIIICFRAIYIILLIMALALDYNNMILGFRFFFIFGLVFGVFSAIVILTLKLAFNLARSIQANGYAMV